MYRGRYDLGKMAKCCQREAERYNVDNVMTKDLLKKGRIIIIMWFMIDEFMLDWKNRYKTIRRIVKRNKFIFSLHRRLTDKRIST